MAPISHADATNRVAAPMQRSGRLSLHALPGGAGRAQTLLTSRKDSLLTAAFERFLDHVSAAFAPSPQGEETAGLVGHGRER